MAQLVDPPQVHPGRQPAEQHVEEPDRAAWQGYGSMHFVSSVQLVFGQPHVQVDSLGSPLGGPIVKGALVDTTGVNVVGGGARFESAIEDDEYVGFGNVVDWGKNADVRDGVRDIDATGAVDDVVAAESNVGVNDADTDTAEALEEVVYGISLEDKLVLLNNERVGVKNSVLHL